MPGPRRIIGVWCLVFVGCAGDPTVRLDVLLQTDYRPGLDFTEVRTVLLDEPVDDESLQVMDTTGSYLSARDVARFRALPAAASRRVSIRLIDRHGAVLGSRTARFSHERDRQQRIPICAACAEFACPLGQTCHCGVTPVCVPEDCEGDGCAGSCTSDADCTSPSVACASSVCRERVCLRTPDDSACDAFEVCDVSVGCVPTSSLPSDGGVDGGLSSDAGEAVPPPRQVWPPSSSVVTSQRPTLRWELAAGSDGALVELCRNRAMSEGCLAPIEASGDRVRTAPLTVGAWFWRARGRSEGRVGEDVSQVWQLWVGVRSAGGDVDTTSGAVTDMNGDGYADFVVGAPLTDVAGRVEAGTVSVYLGSPAGLSAEPSRVFQGPTSGEYFGWSVASAGDVNGDGFGDLLVGAVRASAGAHDQAGVARLYLGGPAGPSATPATVIEGVVEAGELGGAVASAGDVNGDGFTDVLVGAVGASMGEVRVFFGSASGLSATPLVLHGVAGPDRFGVSVASAGDVNGDGFGDILVGADRPSPGGRTRAGTVSVYLGSAAGIIGPPSLVIEGANPEDALGATVAGVGDVNGDGYADIIASAFAASPGGRSGAGMLSLHLGSPSGVSRTPARVLEGESAGDRFGRSIASGDINGDGYSDVMVGAPFGGSGGTLSVYLGSPSGLSGTPAIVLQATIDSRFGRSVACGDADGDGFADIAVGAFLARPAGRVDAGTVSVYVGSSTGLASTPALVLEGPTERGHFGRGVALRWPTRPRRQVFAATASLAWTPPWLLSCSAGG